MNLLLIQNPFRVRLCDLAFVLLIPAVVAAQQSSTKRINGSAEWTVMLYLNGTEGLQESAECVLYQILSVNLNKKLHVVGLLALSDPFAPSDGSLGTASINCAGHPGKVKALNWNGVRRFYIDPDNKQGDPFVSTFIGSRDKMRQPGTLTAFVKWAHRKFKAKHYVLIMKDHGRGTPFFAFKSAIGLDMKLLSAHGIQTTGGFFRPDDNLLLNIEISHALKKALGHDRLDILGFDSCYKALLETAFEMKNVARVLVADETTLFDFAWDYRAFLSLLASYPDIDYFQVGREIVDTFARAQSQSDDPAELSSIDLDALDAILNPLNVWAQLIIDRMTLWDRIVDARKVSPPEQTNNVDIDLFFTNFVKLGSQSNGDVRERELRALAQDLENAIGAVVYSRANAKANDLGSSGLSIYFPACVEESEDDPNRLRYDPSRHGAIPFAQKNAWAKFIREYLQISGLECPPDQ